MLDGFFYYWEWLSHNFGNYVFKPAKVTFKQQETTYSDVMQHPQRTQLKSNY